jgi:hypothetical protein
MLLLFVMYIHSNLWTPGYLLYSSSRIAVLEYMVPAPEIMLCIMDATLNFQVRQNELGGRQIQFGSSGFWN